MFFAIVDYISWGFKLPGPLLVIKGWGRAREDSEACRFDASLRYVSNASLGYRKELTASH